MSVTPAPPPSPTAVLDSGASSATDGANGAAPAPAPESCPLCGAPLLAEQEWCLRCGAAARTRLATTSNWKAPIIAVAVVATLSLGVLAASLVKLAGNSNSNTTTAIVSVTGPGATATVAPTTPTSTTTVTGYPGTASGPLSKEPTLTPPPGPAPAILVMRELIAGTGAEAKVGGKLTVNYLGILFHSGTEFDSSWKRHSRFTFTLGAGKVIAGWEQGLPRMKVGGRRELVIPASAAYGAKGFATVPPVPPNETLVFVVDLLAASPPPPASAPKASTSPAPPKASTSPAPTSRGTSTSGTKAPSHTRAEIEARDRKENEESRRKAGK